MYTLSCNGLSWTVDHVVKGSDYLRAYSADGTPIVSFFGVANFGDFEYTGTYMDPATCLEEPCNDLKLIDAQLKTRDGRTVPASAIGAAPAGYGLGDTSNMITLTSWGLLNATITPGWYRVNFNTWYTGEHLLRVDATGNTIVQTFIHNNEGTISIGKRSRLSSGEWGELVDCSPSAFAPAGYGYGGSPARYSFDNDPDGTLFEAAMDTLLNTMVDGEVRQIRFSDYPLNASGLTSIGGSTYTGTISKHTSAYVTIYGFNYDGNQVMKLKYGGKWNKFYVFNHTSWSGYLPSAFAPAGYGLGTTPKYIADANDAVLPGFYAPNGVSCANVPSEWQFLYGTIIVSKGAAFLEQLFLAGDIMAKRTCDTSGGIWYEWEYINPPMALGVEYRTTEQWNGKHVYTKLLAWTSTTAMNYVGRYEIPHGISNLDSASLRVEMTTEEWIMPQVNSEEALYLSCVDTATNSTKLVVKTTGNAVWDSGRTFYFLMKYCKTT